MVRIGERFESAWEGVKKGAGEVKKGVKAAGRKFQSGGKVAKRETPRPADSAFQKELGAAVAGGMKKRASKTARSDSSESVATGVLETKGKGKTKSFGGLSKTMRGTGEKAWKGMSKAGASIAESFKTAVAGGETKRALKLIQATIVGNEMKLRDLAFRIGNNEKGLATEYKTLAVTTDKLKALQKKYTGTKKV